MEETSPKNIATSIKDEKFLNRFFSRIRRWANNNNNKNTKGDVELLFKEQYELLSSLKEDYPFVSKCGSEINFIRPAATPIVFHSLVGDILFYGGSIGVLFESDRLAVSKKSGKLFYRIFHGEGNCNRKNGTPEELMGLEYGLICSSVGVALSNKISISKQEKFLYDDVAEIDWLPSDYEPGKWAMPDE